ncbi:MAG: hypothetical protein RIQ33_253, partial [Bacteroidota bacterium]
MANIKIPDRVIPGFKVLIQLKKEEVINFSEFLKNLEVGSKFRKIQEFLTPIVGVKDAVETVKTLLSFEELIDSPNVNFEDLAKDLSSSFADILGDEVSKEDIENL